MIIILTDTHFVAEGAGLFGFACAERLAAAVEVINRDHGDAEAVLITGDLVHHGDAPAYRKLADTLAPLTMPVRLMLGNHDGRAGFRDVFGGESGFQQFRMTVDGTPLTCLDTLVDEPSASHGELCRERLDWLTAEIDALPEGPWLLALHHPPMPVGLPNMDGAGLHEPDQLWEVLAPRPPAYMMIGHVHRPIQGVWRGIPFRIGRSIVHQVAYEPEMTEELMFQDEPPEFSILRMMPDGPLFHARAFLAEGPQFPNR